MSRGPEATERARLDALMHRMLGGLLLLGAGLLALLMILLLRLPHVSVGGVELLMLPGTAGRHGLSLLAAPALGAGALVLGLGGLAALALGRQRMPFGRAQPRDGRVLRVRRPALVLLAGTAVLVAVLLRR